MRTRRKKHGPSLRYDLSFAGGVRTYPDGREVCQDNTAGKLQYIVRTAGMLERQLGYCCLCGKNLPLMEATFEHSDTRGMGGARRDDRIEIDGQPVNGAAHSFCNFSKGSRRVTNAANQSRDSKNSPDESTTELRPST